VERPAAAPQVAGIGRARGLQPDPAQDNARRSIMGIALRPGLIGSIVVGVAACGQPRTPANPADGDAGLADAAHSDRPALPLPDGATAPGEGPRPSPGCGSDVPPLTGDSIHTIESGGQSRTYHVHAPASPVGRPEAVVLDFHAVFIDADTEDEISRMRAKADAAGFIAVQPQGTSNSWNAGSCCPPANTDDTDDVAFVRQLLDDVEAHFCVDTRRIFSTGLSNGALLSHRLACEAADRIAAIGPVAGVLAIPTCTPGRPVPVIEFHGAQDLYIPYHGGGILGLASVPQTFADWAQRDGCTGQPMETFRNGMAHCSSYQTCAGGAAVTLCTIDDGGHTWPGGGNPLPESITGVTSTDLSATDAMWDFFSAHPLP
jgi:polyhydroxybutyrate depolymerase